MKETGLDRSVHSLNTSSSKQQYSFSKGKRFSSLAKKPSCESFYQIPSTRSGRGTSFGYGCRDIGLRVDKAIPPVGTYNSPTQFTLHSNTIKFGKGRDEMESGSIFQQLAMQKSIPGPGKYELGSTLAQNKISLRSRLVDHTDKHLVKNPAPGSYQNPEIGSGSYYATSTHRNYTNGKITPEPKLPHLTKDTTLGPCTYSVKNYEINPNGRYSLSKQESSRVRTFEKSPRPDIVYKHIKTNPGPGTYPIFSDFGQA